MSATARFEKLTSYLAKGNIPWLPAGERESLERWIRSLSERDTARVRIHLVESNCVTKVHLMNSALTWQGSAAPLLDVFPAKVVEADLFDLKFILGVKDDEEKKRPTNAYLGRIRSRAR